jgi:hypothetical protein
MSDDPTRNDGPQAPDSPDRSIEDLKAKLGLKPRKVEAPEPAPAAAPAAPAEPRPRPAPPPITEAELAEVHAATPARRSVMWAAIAAGGVMLLFGIIAGGMLKSRAVENSKTREARHLLEYFTETRVAQIGEGNEPILDVVEGHIADLSRVFDALSQGEDLQARAEAEKEFVAFLKRAQAYRDRKAFFTLEQAFPGVIFNGELAARVVGYIALVKQLYDDTVMLALEADTLDRVTELEERQAGQSQIIHVEPFEKDGYKWLKGTWISRIDLENPRPVNGGMSYAMLPVGSGDGFVAETTELVEIDVTPIARDKSMRYRQAIFDRVKARLGSLKAVADQIDFEALKGELQRLGNRGTFVTIF